MRLAAPIDTWDEAIPLGNGLLGGLLWGGDRRLILSLDRGDLWDLRPAAPFGTDGYRWRDLVRLVRENKEDSLHLRFDQPYDEIDHPTKIPAGRIVMELDSTRRIQSFALDLTTAEASVDIGGTRVRAFFDATTHVALLRVPSSTSLTIERPSALDRLHYAPARLGRHGAVQWMEQEAALGLKYAVALGTRTIGGESLVAISIASNRDGADPTAAAQRRVRQALARGYDRSFAGHRRWWAGFWQSSSIAIPDTALQAHLDLVKYLYGAAARRGAPPMPLQGVWTADGGTLPPWKGDFHNDLNTQMTYLAAHVAGLDDALAGWLEFNWDLLPAYRRFARDFYGVSGAAVPGVMALDGQPLGGWAQYSLSPTMGAWVAQSFYLQWRYTNDPHFLRTRALPFASAIGDALRQLLQRDSSGTLRLPVSTSPEIFDNTMQAWLPSMSNFDTALLRWLFGALVDMSVAAGDSSAAGGWRETLRALPPLQYDAGTGALSIARDQPFTESHRHFSHAMSLHPLGILSADLPTDSVAVARTVDGIAAAGPAWWTGYSYAWFSAILARAGRADQALRSVETYRQGFILRNGFHANGDQTRSGLSRYTYRPFTLEGNFMALEAVQEMLLQSTGGVVRVFPATSARWPNASFRDLRAEGGFRVSAQRVDGHTVQVTVRTARPATLTLRDPFDGAQAIWNLAGVRRSGNNYVVPLAAERPLIGRRAKP